MGAAGDRPAASRVDQFAVDSSGVVTRIAGSEQSGATLDNAAGTTSRAAIPSGSLRLAEALVKTSGAGIIGATAGTDYRDRRPWSRGAFATVARTTNASAGNDYTTSSTSYVDIDSTNLKPRIECSGVPLRATLMALPFSNASPNFGGFFHFAVDSTVIAATTDYLAKVTITTSAGNDYPMLTLTWIFTASAGSHLISPRWKVDAGSIGLRTRAGIPLQFAVKEITRPDANNGTA